MGTLSSIGALQLYDDLFLVEDIGNNREQYADSDNYNCGNARGSGFKVVAEEGGQGAHKAELYAVHQYRVLAPPCEDVELGFKIIEQLKIENKQRKVGYNQNIGGTDAALVYGQDARQCRPRYQLRAGS